MMAVCVSAGLQLTRCSLMALSYRTLMSSSLPSGEFREKLRCFQGGSVELLKQPNTGVAMITLNNPARMNAFSGSMMLDLERCVQDLEKWAEGKAVILQGASGNFCSGSDLNAVRAIANPQDGMQMCEFMQNTLSRLLRLPLISVALLEGRALGGGAELSTACDFSDAVIQFVHKRMGLVPGWGGAARLVRIVGSQNALKFLSGVQKIDPDLGKLVGLVDEVLACASGDKTALDQCLKWLEPLIGGPAPVIQAIKSVVVSGRELPLDEALKEERRVFGNVWGGPANLEALASKTKHK
ncbi:hypothetical protein DNTS_020268 [Danionella cerebrum]|uniref:Ethylmalonyl-CoA decarboxylase n=1 Tax=Danionella cerebrum TaxID=2873325 RepID=A0A553MKK5_9TELE|nr:hypothetical protein DNTS_020268 [Danionella translucida]